MQIKNRVMGKRLSRTYSLDVKRDDTGRLMWKPRLSRTTECNPEEYLVFNGTNIRSNSHLFYEINVGDNESVEVYSEVFRADKNEMILYTTKVLSEEDTNKEEMELQLAELLREYNKQEIGKDEELLAYCKLHKLDIENTDVDELIKVVKHNADAYINSVGRIFVCDYTADSRTYATRLVGQWDKNKATVIL